MKVLNAYLVFENLPLMSIFSFHLIIQKSLHSVVFMLKKKEHYERNQN